MAKSPPVPTPRAVSANRATRQEASGPALPPLEVRYYRRMHRQRVYPVTVGWRNKDGRRPPAGTPPVLLRLLMAGAQVVPSEQPLEPAERDARATFYVTPLARGWLRGERLEVLVDGRKVQEIPLASNVTSQRMTLALLVLVFLVPWCLLTYFDRPVVLPRSEAMELGLEADGPQAGKPAKGEMPQGMQMLLGKMLGKMPLGKAGKRPNAKTPAPPADGEPVQADAGPPPGRREPKTPGHLLEMRIKKNVPALPKVIDENAPAVGEFLRDVRRFIADVYQWLIQQTTSYPLAFYSCACLLLLTFISWFAHREKRKRRVGMPIPLPASNLAES